MLLLFLKGRSLNQVDRVFFMKRNRIKQVFISPGNPPPLFFLI